MATGSINFDMLYNDLKANSDGLWGDATDSETAFYAMLPKRSASSLKYGRKVRIDAGTASQHAEGTKNFSAAQKTASIYPDCRPAAFHAVLELTDEAIDGMALVTETEAGMMLAMEQQASLNSIARAVEAACCAGISATNGFIGIQAWINESNTLAGINRATYPRYDAAVDTDVSTRTIAVSVLDGGRAHLVNTHRGRANINITSPTMHDAFAELSTGVVTRQQVIAQDTMTPIQKVIAGIGVANMQDAVHSYAGLPVIRIPDYATDRWDMINLSPDSLYIVEWRKPQWSAWRRDGATMVSDVTYSCNLWLHNPYKNACGILQLTTS